MLACRQTPLAFVTHCFSASCGIYVAKNVILYIRMQKCRCSGEMNFILILQSSRTFDEWVCATERMPYRLERRLKLEWGISNELILYVRSVLFVLFDWPCVLFLEDLEHELTITWGCGLDTQRNDPNVDRPSTAYHFQHHTFSFSQISHSYFALGSKWMEKINVIHTLNNIYIIHK